VASKSPGGGVPVRHARAAATAGGNVVRNLLGRHRQVGILILSRHPAGGAIVMMTCGAWFVRRSCWPCPLRFVVQCASMRGSATVGEIKVEVVEWILIF